MSSGTPLVKSHQRAFTNELPSTHGRYYCDFALNCSSVLASAVA
jgi:hypothetical protein